MALTTLQVRNAKPGRHSDGKGLYLLVKPSGARSWVLRVQVDGTRRDYGIGSVDLSERRADAIPIPLAKRRRLTLKEARDKAEEGRSLAKAGLDPVALWRRTAETVPTFETAARQYHTNSRDGWKNPKHAAQWLSTLETYAFPLLGRLQPDEVDAPKIWAVLGPIWQAKPETARRVRQRIATVLDYAKAHGWRATEAPMRALAQIASKQQAKKGHFAAIPYADLPALITKVQGEETTSGRLALMFAIVTAARSGEVRGATWSEIDLAAARWTVPAGRMKAREEHVVPLSDSAIAILRAAAASSPGRPEDPLFPGTRNQPLSDATLSKALRVAGCAATVHGMRSAFRDWVAEQTKFPGEWAEAALAHALPNKVEAAYRRTRFVEQRRKLMAAWSDYLASTPARVVNIAGRGAR
jgi:integrase